MTQSNEPCCLCRIFFLLFSGLSALNYTEFVEDVSHRRYKNLLNFRFKIRCSWSQNRDHVGLFTQCKNYVGMGEIS